MTQTIGAVHTALVEIIGGVTITSPVALAVRKVWPYRPPAGRMIELPGAIIGHNLTEVRFEPGGMVHQDYDMRIQFFATKSEPELNIGMEIANAFLDAIISALSASVRLDGAVQVVRGMRAAAPEGTILLLGHNGLDHVGLDLIIPITLKDTRTRGA